MWVRRKRYQLNRTFLMTTGQNMEFSRFFYTRRFYPITHTISICSCRAVRLFDFFVNLLMNHCFSSVFSRRKNWIGYYSSNYFAQKRIWRVCKRVPLSGTSDGAVHPSHRIFSRRVRRYTRNCLFCTTESGKKLTEKKSHTVYIELCYT